MLDFYGITLVDDVTGQLEKSTNWIDRFKNLNERSHNYLRITRILTSLGQLGFSRWKRPLVEFFEKEIKQGNLPNCRSALKYWTKCLDEDSEEYKAKTMESPEDRTPSVYFR
eukprot:TRINITY_DN10198_c0_g1_i1.p1 TRINITY_DN10198_c0_g1~~TRINITY_DN10198_c0_g1_i1.p1  ORF type:complete len:126 (+),score=28.37 TRINITY_DN10198_c0_g1_i1:43-378(+)